MHTPALCAVVGLCALLAAPPTAAQELQAFTRSVEERRAELVGVRRDLHRHPELSGEEERTAGIVAARLEAAGWQVEEGVGGHGVVGMLRGALPGPTVAFRADMDAVRSGAPDPVAFRSEVPGVRHICGHDIHTTIGLALAEGFAAVQDQLTGSILLVFQPAEENATGARAMLADGVFERVRPDAIFAFHTAPLEVGQVAVARERMMPGRDRVVVDITGAGDLASVAGAVRDLLAGQATLSGADAATSVAGPFVLGQGVGARETADGAWQAMATLTTSGQETSRSVQAELERGLASLRRGDVDLRLTYDEGWVAGVTNAPALVDHANASARSVLGDEAVVELQAMVPAFSEDFGSFQRTVPGVMYFLGVSNTERGWVGFPHTPGYVADEESIFVGARVMAAILLDLLREGLPSSG